MIHSLQKYFQQNLIQKWYYQRYITTVTNMILKFRWSRRAPLIIQWHWAVNLKTESSQSHGKIWCISHVPCPWTSTWKPGPVRSQNSFFRIQDTRALKKCELSKIFHLSKRFSMNLNRYALPLSIEKLCALCLSQHFLRALSYERESAQKKCKDTEREHTLLFLI